MRIANTFFEVEASGGATPDPASVREMRAEAARLNLWKFRSLINQRFVEGWWQYTVAHELMRFAKKLRAGKRPKLILMSPPQHGKSLQVIDFIAWLVGQAPHTKTIYTSYSDRLGLRANLRMQRLLTSEVYQNVFKEPRLPLVGDRRTPYQRNTNILEFLGQEGSFRNTTVNGPITGESLDLGVIDDPIKGRSEASSQNVRDKTWEWFTDDFFTRFSQDAGMVWILTRWHLDDPAGRLIEHYGDQLRILRYPAIADQDEKYRRRGEALFPELKDLNFLLERRRLQTQSGWEAIYQQNPIMVGGGIFPIDKFRILPTAPPPSQITSSVRYWDKACLLGNTQVLTDRGELPIRDVRVGDRVLTRAGHKRVTRSWLTKHTDTLCSVLFSNGAVVTGTPDHPIFVKPGYWVALSHLTGYDRVLGHEEISQWHDRETQSWRRDISTDAVTLESRVGAISTVMSGTNSHRNKTTDLFTETFGKQPMGLFPLAMMSTTKTTTGITTTSTILNASHHHSITRIMEVIQHLERECLDLFVTGTSRRKLNHTSVSFADETLSPSPQSLHDSVVTRSVFRHYKEHTLESVPVYDLTIEDEHEFFANGVLVHNSTDKRDNDKSAYTAGVLMHALSDGRFVVADVKRGQFAYSDREALIKQTAVMDGYMVDVVVEQEPGSGGKESAERTIQNLAGFTATADRVTGSKEVRAEPYASQQQIGNIYLVKGDWNKAFIDEHEHFPNGKWKDQVDASAGAFMSLTGDLYDSSQSWIGTPEYEMPHIIVPN